MANLNATTERTNLQTKRCSKDEAAALRKNHVVRLLCPRKFVKFPHIIECQFTNRTGFIDAVECTPLWFLDRVAEPNVHAAILVADHGYVVVILFVRFRKRFARSLDRWCVRTRGAVEKQAEKTSKRH